MDVEDTLLIAFENFLTHCDNRSEPETTTKRLMAVISHRPGSLPVLLKRGAYSVDAANQLVKESGASTDEAKTFSAYLSVLIRRLEGYQKIYIWVAAIVTAVVLSTFSSIEKFADILLAISMLVGITFIGALVQDNLLKSLRLIKIFDSSLEHYINSNDE